MIIDFSLNIIDESGKLIYEKLSFNTSHKAKHLFPFLLFRGRPFEEWGLSNLDFGENFYKEPIFNIFTTLIFGHIKENQTSYYKRY